MENSPTRARPWLLALAIALITVFAFAPAFDGAWLHWDDDKNFVENEAWRGLSARNIGWMFTTFHQGPYQPLSWLTLGAEHELWGPNPRGYHVTNVVLHALAAVAFFFFARALFENVSALSSARGWKLDTAAAIAALAFAVHPLRVESVAWVTERRDVLSGLFFALCCLAYVRFATSAGRARTHAFVLALVFYALSLSAKGLGWTLPFGLIVLDALVLRRWNGTLLGSAVEGKRSLLDLGREKTVFLALAIVAAVLAWKGQSEHASMCTLEMWGLGSRIVQSFYGLFFYAWKSLVPLDLIPLVPLPARAGPTEARFAIAIVVVCTVAAVAWLVRRRAPAFGAACIVYALFVGPVLGLTQAGPQLVADRYSYLACMPIALLFGGALLRLTLAKRGQARSILLVGMALVLALVPLTRAQARVWRDDITLWTKTVAVRPHDHPAWRNLTLAYLRLAEAEPDPARGRVLLEGAIAECRRGLATGLDAGLLSNAASAYRSLADVDPERKQLHLETALSFAQRAVERSHEEPTPTKFAHVNYGLTAIDLGRPALAIPAFTWETEHYPDDPDAHLRLAQTFKLAGRPRDALITLTTALKLAPYSPRVWLEKGDAHFAVGEKDDAIACYERGIKLAELLPPELAEDPAEVEGWRAALSNLKKK